MQYASLAIIEMKTRKPIFLKSLYGLSLAFILGILVLFRADKSESSFEKTTGILTFFNKESGLRSNNGVSKFRYLQLDSYPKTFELFIGKDWGDFKPKFEKVDDLKIGDTITIYFDENFKTESDPVNRLAYFIDRGHEPIFVKGSWEKYLAYFIIGLATIVLLILVVAKRKSKIS
jgi:hypothetical protein